uniref:Uncharacterized protein n=1 Tax=Arundo donax TaxID=35708 RepID=A0A0A9E536_ARUDO
MAWLGYSIDHIAVVVSRSICLLVEAPLDVDRIFHEENGNFGDGRVLSLPENVNMCFMPHCLSCYYALSKLIHIRC